MNMPIQTSTNKIYRDIQNLPEPLYSATVLTPSRRPIKTLPGDSYKIVKQSVARKYFSKRVVNLLCSGNYSSREASAYRYKTVKTFRTYMTSLRRSPLRSVERMIISYPSRSTCNAANIMDQISSYKALKSLECYGSLDTILLKPIRTLLNLQDLTLDLSTYQVLVNSETFLNLKALKRFRLVARQTFRKNSKDEGQVFTFCRKLLTKTNLRYAKLDLSHLQSAKDSNLIEGFFKSLIDTKVPAFEIFLGLSVLDSITYVNSIQTFVKTLDMLELVFDNADRDNYRMSINNKGPIEGVCPYLSQPQKKLGLSFSILKGRATQQLVRTQRPTEGLYPSFSQSQKKSSLSFSTLKRRATEQSAPAQDQNFGLANSLKLLYPNINFSGPCARILDDLFIKNLKSLTVSFRNHQAILELKILSEILKNSLHLNYLNLTKTTIMSGQNPDPMESKSLFEMISQLKNLKHLESLSLQNFEFPDPTFQVFSKNIEALSKLRVLQFNCSVFATINPTFSFGTLKNLVRLQITLIGLTPESQRSFIDNLSQLSELEILEIKRGSLLLKNSKIRSALMRALSGLNKLTDVIIDSVTHKLPLAE